MASLELAPIPYDQFYHEFIKEKWVEEQKLHDRLHNQQESLVNNEPEKSPTYIGVDSRDFEFTMEEIQTGDYNYDLSTEQKAVFAAVMGGNNVFITGSAGTGKSLLLKYIRKGLKRRHRKYQVTAPTGLAAVNIDGQTIHSWAGLGRGDKGLHIMLRYLAPKSVNVWRSIDTLIIDEISMVM